MSPLLGLFFFGTPPTRPRRLLGRGGTVGDFSCLSSSGPTMSSWFNGITLGSSTRFPPGDSRRSPRVANTKRGLCAVLQRAPKHFGGWPQASHQVARVTAGFPLSLSFFRQGCDAGGFPPTSRACAPPTVAEGKRYHAPRGFWASISERGRPPSATALSHWNEKQVTALATNVIKTKFECSLNSGYSVFVRGEMMALEVGSASGCVPPREGRK